MKNIKTLLGATPTLLVSLLCSSLSLSCQNHGASPLADKSAASLIQGEWSFTSIPDSGECPCSTSPCLGAPVSAAETIALRISAAGATLTAVREGCCRDQPWAVGTIFGRIVTLLSTRDVACSTTCLLHVSESDTMSFDNGQRLTGEAILIFNGSSACGIGFPLQFQNPIEMQHCASSCGLNCTNVLCPS